MGKRDVRAQLLRRGGAAGIAAGGLDAAGQAPRPVKAEHIVPLPAVHRHRHGVRRADGGVGVHARVGVLPFGLVIAAQDILLTRRAAVIQLLIHVCSSVLRAGAR